MVRRNELFQRWISQPTEANKNRYRRFRNKVTQLIRHAKQSAHEKNLGKTPTSSIIYRSHKTFEKKSNDPTLRDPEKLNEYFETIGPLSSPKKAKQRNDIKMDRVENSIVLLKTNETEVTKKFKLMRNKKVVVMMELVTKFWNAPHQ